MATERLIIRPFDEDFDKLWPALSDTKVKSKNMFYAPGSHRIKEQEFKQMNDSLGDFNLIIDQSQLERIEENGEGIGISNLRLSVQLSSIFTNLSVIVFSKSVSELSDLGELKIPLNLESDVTKSPIMAVHTGFKIKVLLTLDVDRSPVEKDLSPKKKFTILSEALFKFNPDSLGGLGLTLLPLTEEICSQERLPKNTAIYVKSLQDPWEVETLPEASIVYVNDVLLDKTKSLQESSLGKRQRTEIYIQVMDDLIMRVSSHLKIQSELGHALPSYESMRKNVAGKLINLMHNGSAPRENMRIARDELINELSENPYRARTRVQSALMYLNSSLDIFDKEGE